MLICKWEIRPKELINLNFKKVRCRKNMLLNSKILNSILTMIKEMVCYKVTLITLSMMRIIIWVMWWLWDILVSITSTIWPTLTSRKNSLATNLINSLVTNLTWRQFLHLATSRKVSKVRPWYHPRVIRGIIPVPLPKLARGNTHFKTLISRNIWMGKWSALRALSNQAKTSKPIKKRIISKRIYWGGWCRLWWWLGNFL